MVFCALGVVFTISLPAAQAKIPVSMEYRNFVAAKESGPAQYSWVLYFIHSAAYRAHRVGICIWVVSCPCIYGRSWNNSSASANKGRIRVGKFGGHVSVGSCAGSNQEIASHRRALHIFTAWGQPRATTTSRARHA